MAGTLTLLYGLPGSGKTTHMKELKENNPSWVFFDDFMANSHENKPSFLYCRRLGEIIDCLRSGKHCVMADIRLCNADFRAEVVEVVRRLADVPPINWIVFNCASSEAVDICRHNVTHREATQVLRKIDEFSRTFTVEEGAKRIEVQRASTVQPGG